MLLSSNRAKLRVFGSISGLSLFLPTFRDVDTMMIHIILSVLFDFGAVHSLHRD